MAPAQMRILALFGSAVAYGSERANLEVLASLRAQGASVLLVVWDVDYAQEARDYAASHGFEMVAAPHIHPPRPYNKTRPWIDVPVGLWRAMWAFLRIHRAFGPTHIHAGNQLHVFNFMPALALVKTPLVYRCGDAPAMHNRVWRASWRFISRRATRFGAVSRYIADLMVAAGSPRDRIKVVYSRPPARKAAVTKPVAREGFTVGFIGQVIEGKGIGLLIEAFGTLADAYPDARLLVAGHVRDDWDGEPWGPRLKAETLANPKLKARVDFLGFVEDIPGLLERCDVLAAPSLNEEPMGNVVMEAKAAGKASIIFRSGGFPEVIEHGRTGYVCADKTVGDLAEALRFYLADPAQAKRQGVAAKASLRELGVEDFDATWAGIYGEAAR